MGLFTVESKERRPARSQPPEPVYSGVGVGGGVPSSSPVPGDRSPVHCPVRPALQAAPSPLSRQPGPRSRRPRYPAPAQDLRQSAGDEGRGGTRRQRVAHRGARAWVPPGQVVHADRGARARPTVLLLLHRHNYRVHVHVHRVPGRQQLPDRHRAARRRARHHSRPRTAVTCCGWEGNRGTGEEYTDWQPATTPADYDDYSR